MNYNPYFARRLKGLFTITDMEPEALARYMGVTPHTVRLWENGGLVPDVYQFQKIAAFFGLSYEWFLDGTAGTPDAEKLAVQLGLSGETAAPFISAKRTSVRYSLPKPPSPPASSFFKKSSASPRSRLPMYI